MSRRLRFRYLLLVLLWICLISQVFQSAAAVARVTSPTADNGLLDLSAWDFERGGVVKLDGEWEFYWGALLEPDAFDADTVQPTGWVRVPGPWSDFIPLAGDLGQVPVGRHGYATYRLTVDLGKRLGLSASSHLADPEAAGEPLAVYIPYANTSYRLWINGEYAAGNGRVAEDDKIAEPQFLARVARFLPKDDVVELVMQVSNFHFREGGIPLSLEFGLADQVDVRQRRSEMADAFIIGLALFAAVFFFGVAIERLGDMGAAYFSLFVLTTAIRLAFTGNFIAYRLFPGIPWETGLKIGYATGYISPALLYLYMRSAFPAEVSKRAVNTVITISLAGLLVVLFTPGRISSLLIPPYLIILVFYAAYAVLAMRKAATRGRDGAPLFLAGALAYTASILVTAASPAGVFQRIDAIPYGTAAFVISQGWAVARKAARSFAAQDRLLEENARMLKETEWQLAELKRYRRMMTEREEDVRRQIAEMLHGAAQGKLFSALQHIDQAARLIQSDPSQAQQSLAEAKQWLVKLRDEDIRSVSRRLHPTAVAAGLVPALETLVHTYESYFHIDFHVDPAVVALDLPSASQIGYKLRLGMYRVLEEALNNAVRHADARRLTVSLSLITEKSPELPMAASSGANEPPSAPGDDALGPETIRTRREAIIQYLLLVVADDGKGFDPATLTPSLGLRTIDARVGDLNGTWSFTGAVGMGATLSARFPIIPSGKPTAPRPTHTAS